MEPSSLLTVRSDARTGPKEKRSPEIVLWPNLPFSFRVATEFERLAFPALRIHPLRLPVKEECLKWVAPARHFFCLYERGVDFSFCPRPPASASPPPMKKEASNKTFSSPHLDKFTVRRICNLGTSLAVP